MWKDTAARRGLAVLALTLVILSVDLVFGVARADEPTAPKVAPPVSAFIIQQCGKVVGIALTDEHGVIHPVPPEGMNNSVMGVLLTPIPQERKIVATVKCDNGTES